MTPYAARLFSCFSLPAAALGWLWIHSHFEHQRDVAEVHHAQEALEQERDWAREKVARSVQAHESQVRRRQGFLAQLEAAAGGPADLAIKDPNLSLRQMFEQLGAACAPKGSKVRVSIEHFTEFTLTFDSEYPPERAAAVSTILCLLPRCAPYLQAVRFSRQGTLFGELDHTAIASVPDWSSANAAKAQALMRWETPTSPSLTAEGRGAESPAQPDEDPDPALAAAWKAYLDVARAHTDVLNGVIRYQMNAAQLTETLLLSRMRENVTGLAQSLQSLGASKGFFADPALELERALQEQGMDELYTRIAVRGERQRMRPVVAERARVIAAVESHNLAVKAFLEAMIQEWGNWSVQPDGTTIVFTAPSARDVYRKHTGLVQFTGQKVEQAMSALNAAMPK